MLFRICGLTALTLLALSPFVSAITPTSATTETVMFVRYHNTSANGARNAFQFELIERVLEITRAEFGAYKIEAYTGITSAKRLATLLNEGKLMNLHWSSPGTPIAKGEVVQIPVNILQGLLGFRVCITQQAMLPTLARIQTLNDLRNIKIGQGESWNDKLIYQHNNIPVVDAPVLDNLFPILVSGRFECLALGVNEISTKYWQQQAKYHGLVIDPHLLIYYDYPTYLYVSKRTPLLAERVARGLAQLQHSGEYERLFNQHFAQEIAELKLSERTIICLKSPYLMQGPQCVSQIIPPTIASVR